MVELNHDVANVNSDATVKGGHGVVVGVKVTKKGSSGSNYIKKWNYKLCTYSIYSIW